MIEDKTRIEDININGKDLDFWLKSHDNQFWELSATKIISLLPDTWYHITIEERDYNERK